MGLKQEIQQKAREHFGWLQEVRHHLHQHPELSFEEHETSAYIAGQLDAMGVRYHRGIAGTGLIAEIEGVDPGSHHFALRADMDALPITEANSTEYVSQNTGVMHACGHDVHTTSLLGAAKILNATKDSWTGTVRLIFQPGEEKLPGGASMMIKEGALQNPAVSGIIGQHVFPELPAGKVGFRAGSFMAACDELHVTVKGRGGHGAMPHKNIDPVLIASHLVVAMQQIVSRNANPETPSVLSFGRFIAEGATNVIPSEVHLQGTFRTFDDTWRSEAHDRMIKLATDLVQGMGGRVDFRIDKGYPSLQNDPELTLRSISLAREFLGEENVVEIPRRMTAEDFSYYTHEVPGCFYRLGTAGSNGAFRHPVHHPQFDIDEEALITGAGLIAWLAVSQPT